MSYKKAEQILPKEVLRKVQEYIDGECLYIPRISENRKSWGASTSTRRELRDRNEQIYADYLAGHTTEELAQRYFLSLKSIQRIIKRARDAHRR